MAIQPLDVTFLFINVLEECLALTQVQPFVVYNVWDSYLSTSFESLSEGQLLGIRTFV